MSLFSVYSSFFAVLNSDIAGIEEKQTNKKNPNVWVLFLFLFVAFHPSVSAAFSGAVKNSHCVFLMRFPLSRIPQIWLYSPTSFTCIWGSYQWKDIISERGIIHLFSFSDTNVSIFAAFLSWACKFFTGFFLKCLFSGYPVLPCIFLENQVTAPLPHACACFSLPLIFSALTSSCYCSTFHQRLYSWLREAREPMSNMVCIQAIW